MSILQGARPPSHPNELAEQCLSLSKLRACVSALLRTNPESCTAHKQCTSNAQAMHNNAQEMRKQCASNAQAMHKLSQPASQPAMHKQCTSNEQCTSRHYPAYIAACNASPTISRVLVAQTCCAAAPSPKHHALHVVTLSGCKLAASGTHSAEVSFPDGGFTRTRTPAGCKTSKVKVALMAFCKCTWATFTAFTQHEEHPPSLKSLMSANPET